MSKSPDRLGAADPLHPYDAVLVLSYGGPNEPRDVLPFMRNATAGRGIPDQRLMEVSGHYGRFGGKSPINERNAELLDALRAELARRGSRVPVLIGNRNWHPFVSEAMRELADAGARRILTLTTSAYGCYSGCRQYREDTAAALALLASGRDGSTGQGWEADAAARVGGQGGLPVDLTVDKTRPFYNTSGMLEAAVDHALAAISDLAARLSQDHTMQAGAGIRLVFVTHSIPVSMENGSGIHEGEELDQGEAAASKALEPGMSPDLATEISYVTQHELLIQALMPVLRERLAAQGLAADIDYDLAYCSRSGPPQARWLEPDINDHLEALADGHLTDGTPVPRPRGVVVMPIGFVADHMEVVFDLDTEAKETAQELGIPYERAATAGTHPAFVSSLADILAERAAVARGEDITPLTTTGTGPFHTVCPPQCCQSASRHAHPGEAPQHANH